MATRLQPEYDSYAIEEPSDEEPASSSSEDELDVLLHGTPDQKRKMIRECLTGESESSSDDEFEKEMESELSSAMKTMEGSWQSIVPVASTSNGATTSESTAQQFYDDVYFDSDSDEESSNVVQQNKPKRKSKQKVLTNDELLYDPKEDDRDQKWVDARRRRYWNMRKPKQTHPQQSKHQAMPPSDAILNCPACMTTLCLDCQRHESYKTQYRAMFVMNCTVNKQELLRFPVQSSAKNKRQIRKKLKRPQTETGTETEETEMYHPVKCNECSTEVAVYDKEEVYHFFNVLASHC
ncbi:E2F-associated phosphoprotein L homeolog [Xenopus laevis]|uniref:E2F-associated phosphoprotein L homeolog n=1 Tax=Xenopus laevis TaxID=8355 RepID=Q6GPE8_XENLA|nr:E2F-associated phosphoprotein L homeolog [Xenopus laevis]AAH73191.1 MGC80433 protein [Xenopus laevis]